MIIDESLLIKIKDDVKRVRLADVFHNVSSNLVSDDPRAKDEASRKELLMVTEKIMGLGAQILFDYIAKKVQTGTMTAQGLRDDVVHLMETIRKRHNVTEEKPMSNEEVTPEETECKGSDCKATTDKCADPEPKPTDDDSNTSEGDEDSKESDE